MNQNNKTIPKKTRGVLRIKNACYYSISGLITVFKKEVAFRQELFMIVPLNFLLILLPFEISIKIILLLASFLILAIELLNSAIEEGLDLSSKEYSINIKHAKDMASAAVFIMIIAYFILWLIALFTLTS